MLLPWDTLHWGDPNHFPNRMLLCLHDRVSRHALIPIACLYFDVTDDVFPVGVSVGMSFSKRLNRCGSPVSCSVFTYNIRMNLSAVALACGQSGVIFL